MVMATMSIQSTPGSLIIRLNRKGDVDGFHSFTTALLGLVLLVITAFIYKSVIADGVAAIQVLFVLAGVYGLYSVNRQLRGLWLFHAGHDIVEVKDGLFVHSSSCGIWKRRLKMRVADIQGIEFIENPYLSISRVKDLGSTSGDKVIRVWCSSRVQCFLGQFLGAKDSSELHLVLSERLKPFLRSTC
jgi:hypothetical protein